MTFPLLAQAEKIKFKNGLIFEGEVIEETADYIKIKKKDQVYRVERWRIADERWSTKTPGRDRSGPWGNLPQSPLGSNELNVKECVEKLEEDSKIFQQRKDELVATLSTAKDMVQKEPAYNIFLNSIDNLKREAGSLTVCEDCQKFKGLTMREFQGWRDYVWLKFELDRIKGQEKPPEEERLKNAIDEQIKVLKSLEKERQDERGRLSQQFELNLEPSGK
jgi:hypothetical protein